MLNPNLYYYRRIHSEPSFQTIKADICIYGGTSAGVIAAIAAARLGRSVTLLVNGYHLGGLTTSGLGATDFGNKAAIGGLSLEFYRRLGKHYGEPESWHFEPSAALLVYTKWLQEAKVVPHYHAWLDSLEWSGKSIKALVCENGLRVEASVFIDASYEGDLLARADVRYNVGRESSSTYNELFNGVFFGHPQHNFHCALDPYRIPNDPASGYLPEISPDPAGNQGDGDKRVQAYNFRLCLTTKTDNRVPFPKPPGYTSERYELLRRYIAAGFHDALNLTIMMPNGKTDTNNNGAFSTDFIGGNYGWPEGSYAEREKIFQAHVNYVSGLLYFLQNEPGLPKAVLSQTASLGLAKDEFTTTGNWPPQLYIREARRMVGEYVITEHDCFARNCAEDSVGLGSYGMDSHNCQRTYRHGRVINEGNVEIHGFPPYPISLRSITPRIGDCENLVVPVCVSASHIAYGSLRMEPVFMVLGESAAVVADVALNKQCPVQSIPYGHLHDRLVKAGQVLTWESGVPIN